jgi:hypothetical protein
MIDPPSLMWGRLAWITLKTPTRSVSMVSDHDWIVGDRLPYCGALTHVDDRGVHAHTFLLCQACGLVRILRPGQRVGVALQIGADIERDDVGAFSREPHGVRPPLRAGGPGNERHATLQ